LVSDFNPYILAGLARKGEKSIENYIDRAGVENTPNPEVVPADFEYKIDRVTNTSN